MKLLALSVVVLAAGVWLAGFAIRAILDERVLQRAVRPPPAGPLERGRARRGAECWSTGMEDEHW